MRIGNVCWLLLAVLTFAGQASAQQDAVSTSESVQGKKAEGKEAQGKSGINIAIAPSNENWLALDDLKTGLEHRPSEVIQTDEEPDFVRELVRVQWRPIDEIDLWVIRPKSPNKVPVILYLYSYLESSDRFRDRGWCQRATADG